MTPMNKLDFTKQSKQIIIERDSCCIYCGAHHRLTYAHNIPRSKGGLGIPQNGVLLCIRCHHALDNGHDSDLANAIQEYIDSYLKRHYGEIKRSEATYQKWKGYKYE